MNGCSYLQKVVEDTGYAVTIESDKPNSLVRLIWNGQSWTGNTLDQCISAMKESFAIMYLENIEKK